MNDVENGMLDYSEYDDGYYIGSWLGGWGRHDDDDVWAVYDPQD